jgi:hypothetical protein
MTAHLYARIAELESENEQFRDLLEQAEEALTILWAANVAMNKARADQIPEPDSKTVN